MKKAFTFSYTLLLGAALVLGFAVAFDAPVQAYTSCPSFACGSTGDLTYLGTCINDPGHGCLYPCSLYEGYQVPGTPFQARCYDNCSEYPL